MPLMRKFLLALSTNAWMREKATRTRFVRRSVSRFMPGEEIDDALRAAATLKGEGFTTILTKLGENLTGWRRPSRSRSTISTSFDRVAAGLDAQISVKPTQLGLDLDRDLCQRNLERLLERAEQRNNFLWIDMESSPYVDPTIELYRRARGRSARVGLALQSYLYRTAKDIEDLIPLGPAIRMVKGAYLEPADVAYPKKSDVDESFYRLCARLMGADARQSGTLLHIGTHDPALIDRLIAHIDQHGVPPSAYEFAMLYGIQRAQQVRLAAAGQPTRVLISYGEYWFPWYMRRLAERPANVWFVVKSMVRR
jgi:proline dehydrogenase